MLIAGLIVSLVPVVICFLFGAMYCEMNRALLFGAMMGARTCAPAMEIISDTARSNIPALGYAGTYAIAERPADAGRDNHRHGMARIR